MNGCRLVDVISDDGDYFWEIDTEEDGHIYSSCVIRWIPLKGFIKDEDYNKLVRLWNLNNTESAI